MKLLFSQPFVTILGKGHKMWDIVCVKKGSLPFPLWAKQVQKENTQMLHEVQKENTQKFHELTLPWKSAGEHSSKLWDLMNFALLS
jgi:hypothetical protein